MRYGLFFLLGLLLFASCDPKRRTQTTPPSRPTVKAPESQGKDVDSLTLPKPGSLPDTLSIVKLDPEKVLDLDLPVGPNGATVSLMLPFFSDRYYNSAASLPQNSEWAVGYYAGMRMAVEELERKGERATIQVYDTKGNPGTSQGLITDPELRNSHVLFAPYLTKNVKAILGPAQAAGLPIVVPFSANAGLVNNYPRFVQLNPSLLRHLDAMAAFLAENYQPNQVVLVGLPNGEQNQEVAYLMRRHREFSPKQASWRTWQLETGDMGLQGLAWQGKFVKGKETIFVFPAYRNAKIVLSFLSQLQIGRTANQASVMGMPQWSEFQQLDPTLMEDLKVLITAGLFIDSDDFNTQSFSSQYASRYGALPQLEAYLGYDAMKLVLPLANKYGRAWPEHLPASYEGLASQYRIKPQYADGAPRSAETPAVQMENEAVHMLRFENFTFQPLD